MRRFALVLASSLALLAVPAIALGAGSGNSGSSGGKRCPKGFEWSKKKKKCVQKQSRISPEQQQLIDQAWMLARGGHFEAGRKLFGSVADQSDPEVLNGLGYTNRKLGFFQDAIGYYKQAVKIDPDYVQAREYLGEGYATMGRLDLAREQLGEIERRCGTTCEEYVDLKDAIDTAIKTSSR